MEPLLKSALGLAERGIPVFACRSNKRPATENGFKDASTDSATITRMFANPLAALIGVPTGAVSGFDVIDVDPEKGGDAWLREHESRLPATRRHHTRRPGGIHLFLKHAAGLKGSTDTFAPGVDLRADGNYIIWWPAAGNFVVEGVWAAWPADLLLTAMRTQPREQTNVASPEDLAPPDAGSLLRLLAAMPNPESAGRDDYVAVNLAVQGCIRSLEALNRLEDATPVYDAAAEWSARWESAGASDFAIERTRWDDDWSQRDNDRAGWRHLLGLAGKLGADTTAFALAAAVSEFGPALPDESETAPRPEPGAVTSYRFRRGHNPYGDRRWLVHQALPETGVAFLAGQYGSGKTFVALDLAYAAMTGAPFAGMDIDRRGGVLFLAAEGEAEIPVRLEALMQSRGDVSDTLPFLWRDDVPVLLERGSTDKLVSAVRDAAAQFEAEGMPLALVVIDTLAAAAGWSDENNAAEAQAAIRVMQAMAKESGALVLAVDHHGKDKAAGVRGSTAKAAGAEAVLSVLCDKQDNGATTNRRLALHKVRGGASGREIAFNLRDTVAGEDAHGRPVTTCTIEWQTDTPPAVATPEPVLRGNTKAFHDLFATEIDQAGGVATEDALCQACEDASISNAKERKARTREFNRAKQKLIEFGLIREAAGIVWLVGSAYDDFVGAPLSPERDIQ